MPMAGGGTFQCAPVVGKEGEFCCTALSSSSSRSSSDRLLPRAEVMAAADGSDGFCLFGKLSRGDRETTVKCFYWRKEEQHHPTWKYNDTVNSEGDPPWPTCRRAPLQCETVGGWCPRTRSLSWPNLRTADDTWMVLHWYMKHKACSVVLCLKAGSGHLVSIGTKHSTRCFCVSGRHVSLCREGHGRPGL